MEKVKNLSEEQKILIPHAIRKEITSTVYLELIKMPSQVQEEFIEEYKRKKKMIGMAYFLWIIGLHYFYFNKWGNQIIFWLTVGGVLIWWFIDLFRIPSMVQNYNRDIAMEILKSLKIITSESR